MDWQVTIEPIKGKAGNPAYDLPESRSFDFGTAQIVFGRESNCDVVFPPDARMVGGRHGRLYRQPSGDYALEAFGNHTFFVNDYPPQPNQPITGDATIRFGNSKGPVIRVLLKRGARSDGLKDTTDQDEVVPPSRTAAQIKKAVAALAVVVVVVAVALGGNYYLDHLRVQTVNQQLADMQDVMSKQAQEGFPPTESLRQAAFAVILENTNGRPQVIGTAWPLQAGMLVTNAHIAAVMDSLKAGETLVVRKLGAADNIVVKDKIIHAGYEAFNEFVDNAIKESKGFASLTDGVAMPSAYDVAILKVDPSADIGPMLTFSKDPAALAAGTALAFAGYPIEGTGAQNTAQFSPNPQVQYGRVTTLSDYFLFNADTANALLVQDSLPATGGASGSPIIDASGTVVAVLSGGTVDYRNGVRTPSAVMLNYAQRADLIDGLLNPESFDLKAATAAWEEALAVFNDHENSVVADAVAALEQTTGGPVDTPIKERKSLKSGEAKDAGTVRYLEQEVKVAAGRSYTYIVYGDYNGSLNLMLMRDSRGVTATHGSSWFASLTYTADRDETLTLRVLGQQKHQVDYYLYKLTAQKAVAAAATSTN